MTQSAVEAAHLCPASGPLVVGMNAAALPSTRTPLPPSASWHPETHSKLKVTFRLRHSAGLVFQINLIVSIGDLHWYCLSLCPSPCRPPRLPPAVPVWTSGLHLFPSAAEERSRLQTMSRQARRPTPAPVLHFAQTARRTETSRWKEKGKNTAEHITHPHLLLTPSVPPGVGGRSWDPQWDTELSCRSHSFSLLLNQLPQLGGWGRSRTRLFKCTRSLAWSCN